MKTRADFEQTAYSAPHVDRAFGRLGDSAEDFQQRALARAIAANQSDAFTLLDAERDVLERPKRIGVVCNRQGGFEESLRQADCAHEHVAEHLVMFFGAKLVALAEAVDVDRDVTHVVDYLKLDIS